MNDLQAWADRVVAELGLSESMDGPTLRMILDLARDAAHGVARPAAPLTTYLLGIAVGRGADPATAAAQITALTVGETPESA